MCRSGPGRRVCSTTTGTILIGLGFCCGRFYDTKTNPWNIMFSVPVNAHIVGGVQAKFVVSRKMEAGLGFYFNHCKGFEPALIVEAKDQDKAPHKLSRDERRLSAGTSTKDSSLTCSLPEAQGPQIHGGRKHSDLYRKTILNCLISGFTMRPHRVKAKKKRNTASASLFY